MEASGLSQGHLGEWFRPAVAVPLEVVMRLTDLAVVVVLALGGVAYPEFASAQDRKGVWFGAGLGYNSVAFGCATCDDRVSDIAPYVRVGWTLHPQISIGLDLNVWTKFLAMGVDPEAIGSMSTPTTFLNQSATLMVYPKDSSNLFVKGGVGFQLVSIPCPTTKCALDNRGPFLEGFVESRTLHAGIGYDIRVGRRIALTPSLDYSSISAGELALSKQGYVNRCRQNKIAATIGITLP